MLVILSDCPGCHLTIVEIMAQITVVALRSVKLCRGKTCQSVHHQRKMKVAFRLSTRGQVTLDDDNDTIGLSRPFS